MKTKIRRFLLLLPGLLLGFSVAAGFAPQHVHAITTSPDTGGNAATISSFDTNVNQHIDRSTILYNGQYYFDSKIDDNYNYKNQGDNDGCQDYIDHLTDGNSHATLHVRTKNAVNGGCEENKSTITLQHTERSNMPFDYIDANTITTSDQQTTYTYNDQLKEFLENGGDQCKDTIKVTAGPSDSGATLEVTASTGGDNTSYDNWDSPSFDTSNSSDGGNGCTNFGPNKFTASTVYLNNSSVLQASPAASAASGSGVNGAGGDTAGSPDVDCGGLSLNWIVCPIELGLQKAVSGIDGIINNLLEVNTDSIFSNCAAGATSTNCKTSNAYKKAWSSMRSIALALLVLGVLIMVIAQASGFDAIDAYTIRKVLPRVIIAAIGITLSWVLLKFFVSFANDVGNSIRALIYAPFSGLSKGIHPGWAGGLGVGILTLAGSILLGFGLLSFLATALLAVLLAVLVLIIRQVLIVFLIIIAPIAIVSYILPNTKKMYDIWWDFFAKGLMMFPFIAAFIATGRVFAQVASEQAQSAASGAITSQVYGILAFVSYFAPYFLLPLTLRFAGGALGTIGGFVNDRSKGGFDRLRQYRANRAKDRFQRAQSQSLWDNNSRIGRQANKVATWVTSPGSNAAYYGRNIPGLRKAGYRVASQIGQAKVEQSGKLFEELNKLGYNDKAYRVLTGQWSAKQRRVFEAHGIKEAPKTLDDLRKIANVMQTDTTKDENGDLLLSQTDRIGGAAIDGSLGRLATLYRDPEMTKANLQAAGIMGLSAHGFASGEDLAGVGNDLTDGGKDASFAQAIISQSQVMGARSRPDIKAGYGIVIKTNEDGAKQFVSGISAEGGRADALLDTLSAQDLAGAKGGAIDALKSTIYDRLVIQPERAAQGNLSPEQKATIKRKQDAQKDQLFQWASPYSVASNDVKVKALEMIDELGLRSEFDSTVNIRNMTPEQREELLRRGIPVPEEPNQQGRPSGP